MPGCVSQGHTREEALANVREGMAGWMASEAYQDRQPFVETAETVSASVSEALEILEQMRQAGEIPADSGYELELTTVEVLQPVPA